VWRSSRFGQSQFARIASFERVHAATPLLRGDFPPRYEEALLERRRRFIRSPPCTPTYFDVKAKPINARRNARQRKGANYRIVFNSPILPHDRADVRHRFQPQPFHFDPGGRLIRGGSA
jgi:hypothetical protein